MKLNLTCLISGLIFVLGFHSSQSAQASKGINLHQIFPAKNTRFLTVESPTLSPVIEDMVYLPELDLDYGRYYREFYSRSYFEFNFDYVNDPLVRIDPATNQRIESLVSSMSSFNFSFGRQIDPRIGLFGEMGVHQVAIPQSNFVIKNGNFTTLGDSRLILKILLNPPNDDQRKLTFALIPELILPTGDTQFFTSVGTLGWGGHLSVEREWGKLILSGNLGFRYAQNAFYSGIRYQRMVPFAFGALYRWNDHWGVVTEFSGAAAIDSSDFQNRAEAFLGPRYRVNRDWTLLAALGTGKFRDNMSNDFRGILQVKFSPFKTPTRLERAAPVGVAATKTLDVPCSLGNILFANASTELSAKAKASLEVFAKRVLDQSQTPKVKLIQVQGHASPTGSPVKNQELSEGRSEVARDYLVNLGVPDDLIQIRAYSQTAVPKGQFKSRKEKLEAWRRAEFFCEY